MITVEGRNAAILVRCTVCREQIGIGPGFVELSVAADQLHAFQGKHLRCKEQGELPLLIPIKVELAPSDPAKADEVKESAAILRARMGKIG